MEDFIRLDRLFVLQHWERLCECNPKKRRLLYRHSIAELDELLGMTENVISGSTYNPQRKDLPGRNTCYTDSGSLTKKVLLLFQLAY